MALNTLQDLFAHELKDVYSAEKQITKALPKMIKRVGSENLKAALQSHLEETEEQVRRLEKIFATLGQSPGKVLCKGMEGLLKEAGEMLEEDGEECVLDSGAITAAQRVEHYEIAAYGCLVTFAKLLQNAEAEDLLQQTLDEEKAADEKLTEIAEALNAEANDSDKSDEAEDKDEDEDEEGATSRKGSISRERAN